MKLLPIILLIPSILLAGFDQRGTQPNLLKHNYVLTPAIQISQLLKEADRLDELGRHFDAWCEREAARIKLQRMKETL